MNRFSTTLLAGAAILATASGAHASTVFSQGYEVDTTPWFTESNGWAGTIDRETVADAGITPFEGMYYGRFSQTFGAAAGGVTGPFNSEGRTDVFPGPYQVRSAIYLNTGWAAGEGFDYSTASNGSDNMHQRDFIFHVTKDTSTGDLLVGGSNNTNFDPREDLELGNHYVVPMSGWYIFEHSFRDDGGVLAVDLNLYDALDNLLFTETRMNAADTIPAEVGGFRYSWFTNIDVSGGIAVDNSSLSVPMPVPATLPLLGAGLAVMGLVAHRRKAK